MRLSGSARALRRRRKAEALASPRSLRASSSSSPEPITL
jgi:hypothetical protein